MCVCVMDGNANRKAWDLICAIFLVLFARWLELDDDGDDDVNEWVSFLVESCVLTTKWILK